MDVELAGLLRSIREGPNDLDAIETLIVALADRLMDVGVDDRIKAVARLVQAVRNHECLRKTLTGQFTTRHNCRTSTASRVIPMGSRSGEEEVWEDLEGQVVNRPGSALQPDCWYALRFLRNKRPVPSGTDFQLTLQIVSLDTALVSPRRG